MKRTAGFIEPCLPSTADRPPPGSGWIHEIKHDGFRLLACRGPAGVRLVTRNGNDFTARYPLIVEAVEALPVRTCVIDGEAVAWPHFPFLAAYILVSGATGVTGVTTEDMAAFRVVPRGGTGGTDDATGSTGSLRSSTSSLLDRLWFPR
jgi:hypothetical protein